MANPTGWIKAGTLPATMYAADCTTYNGYLYVLGGISAGGINRLIEGGLSAGNTLAASFAASHLTITAAIGTGSAPAWSVTPSVGDIFTIPPLSVVAGAGNANVGNYTVTSATATTVVGTVTLATQVPVNVGAATIAAGGGNIFDYSAPTTSVNIYSTPIAANGTLGAWTIAGVLPSGRSYSNIVRIGQTFVIAGGLDPNLNGVGQMWVYQINGNGTLTYQANKSTGFFNAGNGAVAVQVIGQQMVIEGANASGTGTFLQVANINTDDTVGAFASFAGPSTSSKGLLGSQVAAMPYLNKVLIHGGVDAAGATPATYANVTAYTFSPNTNALKYGVSWPTVGYSPTNLSFQGFIANQNTNIVWVVGGTTTGQNAGAVAGCYAYDLNTAGGAGNLLPAPITCTSLPLALCNPGVAFDNRGILLSVGGIGTTGTITNNIYSAMPQGNGVF